MAMRRGQGLRRSLMASGAMRSIDQRITHYVQTRRQIERQMTAVDAAIRSGVAADDTIAVAAGAARLQSLRKFAAQYDDNIAVLRGAAASGRGESGDMMALPGPSARLRVDDGGKVALFSQPLAWLSKVLQPQGSRSYGG